MFYVDVILPLSLDGVFTYSVPCDISQKIMEGGLVIVPFSSNKLYTGLVYKVYTQKPNSIYRIREIQEVVSDEVYFSKPYMDFLMWISEYYICPIGDVFRMAMPNRFRLESLTEIIRTDKFYSEDISDRQQYILNNIPSYNNISLKDLQNTVGGGNIIPHINQLISKGYIDVNESIVKSKINFKQRWIKLFDDFSDDEIDDIKKSLNRAPSQYNLFHYILNCGVGGAKYEDVSSSFKNISGLIKELCRKEFLMIEEREINIYDDIIEGKSDIKLSPIQNNALNQIRDALYVSHTALLNGVTGSGKTYIYIKLIEEYIEKGKQVLYLLPEISLTIQAVELIKNHFGNIVGVYHSGITDKKKAELWKIQMGENPYKIIVGVRASIFIPMPNIGLVIIDEEQDISYKQWDSNPRYNVRDAVIWLSSLLKFKVVLGSATPSMDTYYNALSGKYSLIRLKERYSGINDVNLSIVDIGKNKARLKSGNILSTDLYKSIKNVINNGEQVLIFHNKRAYSSSVICSECGYIPKCKNCDISLSYYKTKNALVCRYCGHKERVNIGCAKCGVGNYKMPFAGIEKVGEEISRLFHNARISVLDEDTTNRKSKFSKIISDFRDRKIDILIGGNLISKGLHFKSLALVGIVDTDYLLYLSDFRAEERAFINMLQIIGRGGGRDVIIQTSTPENRVFSMLDENNYEEFYYKIFAERKLFGYPPYSRLINIELRHRDANLLEKAADMLIKFMTSSSSDYCSILGPSIPDISKIANQYRRSIIIKINNNKESIFVAKHNLRKIISEIKAVKGNSSLRFIIDVDPN